MLRYVAVALFAVAPVALTACSSSVDEAEQEAARPAPVRELVSPRTAEEAVLRVRRHIAGRLTPLAVAQYDSRLRVAVAESDLLGALALVAPTVAGADVRTIHKEQIGKLVVLTLDVANDDGSMTMNSYVVRRIKGEWMILYDSLVGDAIGSYVQSRVQLAVAPKSQQPDPQSLQAGSRARQRFEQMAIEITDLAGLGAIKKSPVNP